MWRIPIVKSGSAHETSDKSLDDLRSLPVYYMGDYSVIGIRVDKLDEAAGVLRSSGYAVECESRECSAEIPVKNSEGIQQLLDLLRANGIRSDYGDVTREIYRG
ncbi:MAG: hypothetical protein AB9866_25650 [Syntrophobacteraceae bacterium]